MKKGVIYFMKRRELFVAADGTTQYRPKDLKHKLNLNYLDLTNKSQLSERLELPELHCDTDVYPDFLALFSEPGEYHRTKRTAVCTFEYDDVFDGQHGLANAIYYRNKRDIAKFEKRFAGVHFFISPDISLLGDVDVIENLNRIKRARITSLWLSLKMHAVVIPLITYPNIEYMDIVLNGLEQCTVVAFSTKGFIKNAEERVALKEAIRITVDRLPLKAIVIYDVCADCYEVYDIFDYAIRKGVKLIIPPNTLQIRNRRRKDGDENA